VSAEFLSTLSSFDDGRLDYARTATVNQLDQRIDPYQGIALRYQGTPAHGMELRLMMLVRLLPRRSSLQVGFQLAVYVVDIFNRNAMRSLRDLHIMRACNSFRERASAARREDDVFLRTQYQHGKLC
jgi:hypothetical protein